MDPEQNTATMTDWEPVSPEELDARKPAPPSGGPPQNDPPSMDPPEPKSDDRENLLNMVLDTNRRLERELESVKQQMQPKQEQPVTNAESFLAEKLEAMGMNKDDRALFEDFGKTLIEAARQEFLGKQYEPILGQVSVSMADYHALTSVAGKDAPQEQLQKAQQFISDKRAKGTSMNAEELAEWAIDRAKAQPSPTAEARRAKEEAARRAAPPVNRSVHTPVPQNEVSDEEWENLPYETKRQYYLQRYRKQ